MDYRSCRTLFKHYWDIRKGFALRRFVFNYRRRVRKSLITPVKSEVLFQHDYFSYLASEYEARNRQNNLEAIYTKANQIIELPLLTITDKPLVPNSGTKNDYLSFAPYYWHDKNENPLLKAQLPGFQLDGRPNPFLTERSDKPRLAQCCARVHLLSIAYLSSNNSHYLSYLEKQLVTWFIDERTKMRPNMNFAQIVPWRGQRFGLGIIDARWLVLLIDAVALLQQKRLLKQEIVTAIADWLLQFANWMLTSRAGLFELSMKNNRGSWTDVLLVYISLVFDKPDAAREVLGYSLTRRPKEQLDELYDQPFELKRYTYVSYSLYNFFPIYYLFNIEQWMAKYYAYDSVSAGFEITKFVEGIRRLSVKIAPHEKGKIENIDFTESFNLNLYYPYSYSQLKSFPCINPFPSK